MEIYKLLPEHHPILKTSIPEVDEETADKEEIKTIAEILQETRKAHKALGLAANQVGLNVRMFVMGKEFAEFVCINPKIISKGEDEERGREGCLSFPNLVLDVKRPAVIQVSYLDVDLKEVTCEFKGIFAKCFQHELDHLDGVTFTDRVSKLKLAMANKKRQVKQRYR